MSENTIEPIARWKGGIPYNKDGEALDPTWVYVNDPHKPQRFISAPSARAASHAARLTDPYGGLLYTFGSDDDFVCVDFARIGGVWFFEAVANSETGAFTEGFGYEEVEDAADVLDVANDFIDRATSWCIDQGIEFDETENLDTSRRLIEDVKNAMTDPPPMTAADVPDTVPSEDEQANEFAQKTLGYDGDVFDMPLDFAKFLLRLSKRLEEAEEQIQVLQDKLEQAEIKIDKLADGK